jgi:hypothetical protein
LAPLNGGGFAFFITEDEGGLGVGEGELGLDGDGRDECGDFEGAGDVGGGRSGRISGSGVLGVEEGWEKSHYR